MAKPEPLRVWLGGSEVATLTPRRPWRLDCRYTPAAIERWPGLSPLLSCSLPLQSRRMDASVFLAGLLPEGQHRQAMAAEAKVAVNDVYALLLRFGRDVAGALVIASRPPDPRAPSVAPYGSAGLEREVEELPERPLAIHEDSELSIGGLQDKLLLVRMPDGGWGRPVHGYPSTHILKADDLLRPGLVRAESECLALARAVGLTDVTAELHTIAGRQCLIVSRFDRRRDREGGIERIHQEDLCQALARNPEAARGRGKYEDASGPSLRDAAGLLDRYSADPALQLDRLLAAATFTVLTGNADAHGKNMALLHPTAETVELAPLYDTVPTALWPKLRTRGAMSVGGRWELSAITVEDLLEEASGWRLDRGRAARVVAETTESVRESLAVLRDDSEVLRYVRERVDALTRSA